MTIETQKEVERAILINFVKDVVDTQPLTPELGIMAAKLIEQTTLTDMCEAQVVRQNRLAGYGERLN